MCRVARVAVLSAGSWGTTMAKVFADAGSDVVVHARRDEVADAINTAHQNPRYLPDVLLPPRLRATTNATEALAGAAYVVLSIPAQTLRENLAAWAPYIGADAVVVSLMKGIETHSGLRMSEVIGEVTGIPADRIAVLSGPNLAREIAGGQPAASVIACPDETAAAALQAACHTPYFRPYTATDVAGCELGGATKNVIALAVGLAAGLGLGDNARALLITRGLAETARLGAALGADPLTFSGLAGAGDLIATCSSPLSRNRTFGEHLGQGMSVDQAARATGQTAEGVKSCRAILDLARAHGAEMPITEVVAAVIDGTATVADAAAALMSRTPKPEHYGA
ncbi:NAD(P)H-dependent glycerol-3-phosphate dehydrogenase [Streptomyces sp. NBC_00198]|uniref:NAD(P)H-dependent glycerol-3-phosphate dehydrogenase n=1 Tax=Streptomyces sp. NBC_00198 TaxID=2975677 RepID=UPI0022571323|nr:NAD(P)H-dependent glycerol-3-phosphate dehydrogenase [Streptomyces sp. NBC_00198]MCX5285950.1 NAD(P)-dependent glycerol-3-phosphate dehydrogenase [Streptomyces sp. NBC_00198]MCX5286259.1 NAD(P)-dependent glycerol-3-phosphate dehydrogenase [Streptomyces sp. NBC_00198]